MPRTILGAAGLVLALRIAAPAERPAGGWGADVDAGAGAKLLASVSGEVAALVQAAPDARPELARALAAKHGTTAIEALKRFRDPALLELVRALLEAPDWHVRHRALLLADGLREPAGFALAWPLLAHAEPRLREKAALSCLLLWEPKRAKECAAGRPLAELKSELAKLVAAESDEQVRGALAALQQRLAGKLEPRRLATETTVRLPEGVAVLPFLEGMHTLAQVAPGVRLTASGSPGGGSAEKLPVAARWVAPLVRWGEEEVPGLSLQPFANPRERGVVHTGLDTGGCLDGAGYYAVADGVVRFVHSGSDMGTLIVVEHHRAKKELVNAVYMHGGPVVFVAAGDKVAAGQLLGTMGIGYSIENGGHYAHLHLGLYPGPFDVAHNYGYKPAKDGLADWLDPAKELKAWIAQSAPPARK